MIIFAISWTRKAWSPLSVCLFLFLFLARQVSGIKINHSCGLSFEQSHAPPCEPDLSHCKSLDIYLPLRPPSCTLPTCACSTLPIYATAATKRVVLVLTLVPRRFIAVLTRDSDLDQMLLLLASEWWVFFIIFALMGKINVRSLDRIGNLVCRRSILKTTSD